MLCPQGHPVPATASLAQFCPACGSALINPCPVGHDNAPNARFCRECGRSMTKPSGTPSATTAVVPPTTAVIPPRTDPGTPSARSVGTRPVVPAPIPPTDESEARPDERGHRGLLIAIAVLAAAVVGMVVALVATSSGGTDTAGTVPGDTPNTPVAPSPTTAPATTSTSTTLSAQALPAGQSLTALLTQSSGSRSQVQTATVAIASCGDLAGAQSALAAAQSSRQTLLSQLGQLDLAPLPDSAALITALTNAWQSSASSDGSYAQWAADEQAKPCVPNDSTDPGYQSSLAADGHASTAKQQFASIWNPIATSLGLRQWQPNQF
jgi:hypothetical protein